jgi:hypothetical protein
MPRFEITNAGLHWDYSDGPDDPIGPLGAECDPTADNRNPLLALILEYPLAANTIASPEAKRQANLVTGLRCSYVITKGDYGLVSPSY